MKEELPSKTTSTSEMDGLLDIQSDPLPLIQFLNMLLLLEEMSPGCLEKSIHILKLIHLDLNGLRTCLLEDPSLEPTT